MPKPPGVFRGGELVKVKVGGEDQFYQVYEFPPGSGQFLSFRFNDRKAVKAALGEDFDVSRRSDKWYGRHVVAEGDAEEVIGKGSFHRFTREIIEDAAAAQGINDPTLVGQIANDPEMQAIMVQATIGDWTGEQIIAAQRQTAFWKNTLYPGIENFYSMTTNPEKAWLDYKNNLQPALVTLGFTGDDVSGVIGDMLSRGVNDQVFLSQVPTFIQAQQNSRFADVLQLWAEKTLDKKIDFGDWFDLVAGESAPDLARVAERAQLAYAAQEQGSAIKNRQIRRLARRTDLSSPQMFQTFSEFNQAILALGDSGLKRGGLSKQDVLFAAAGINPENGLSVDEVKLKVAKLARENDLFDEDKIDFYVGFSPFGTPNRPGLASLAPEGA